MRWLLAVILVLAATPTLAEEVNDQDRFELWNACRPVELVVERLSPDAREIGLRQGDIETAARSRLRSARIYDDMASAFLYVNINVVGAAFSFEVAFARYVEVILPQWLKQEGIWSHVGLAATWKLGVTGTHATGSNYILSSVALRIDEFIDEYLRVNADACQ